MIPSTVSHCAIYSPFVSRDGVGQLCSITIIHSENHHFHDMVQSMESIFTKGYTYSQNMGYLKKMKSQKADYVKFLHHTVVVVTLRRGSPPCGNVISSARRPSVCGHTSGHPKCSSYGSIYFQLPLYTYMSLQLQNDKVQTLGANIHMAGLARRTSSSDRR